MPRIRSAAKRMRQGRARTVQNRTHRSALRTALRKVRAATGADAGAFEETVIEVPLRSETVEVQKRARVAEEVVLSKEAVQRTEQVSGTVRREEVLVDEDATLIEDTEGGSSRRS